jgi:sugar phosphate isomerase/epimerase
MHRRHFLTRAAAAALALREAFAQKGAALRFGMCSWSLGGKDPSVFELAKRIGLEGIQLDLGRWQDAAPLRQAEVRRPYREAARAAGMAIPSTAIVGYNQVPLKSEPQAALWLLDSVEATRDLGARVHMLAFFSKGELKEENTEEIERVVDVLREVAPRAEKAGVILGIENTLTAKTNLAILEKVNSPAVQVWYDIGNTFNKGYDVPAEIRMLAGRICQFHIKDNPHLLGQGKLPFPEVARAIRDIGYRGWLILETASPNKDIEADARRNLAFARQVFT